MKHYLILLAGVIGVASSVFFIKESALPPAMLSTVRLLLSALILSPFAAIQLRKQAAPRSASIRAVLPAALPLAMHYLTWFVGVRHTSAAMSTLIINLTPVFMPFLVWMLLRERVTRGEIVGSVFAIAGVVVLALSKDDAGLNTVGGIAIRIFSISLCALYLALGRKYARGRPIFAYIVPLYAIAGLISLLGVLARHESVPPITLHEVLIDLGAVIFPTVIGHTALNFAMVHLPPQVVSIANLGQFVVVAILAIPILGEYPHLNLVLPAFLVLSGALIVIRAAPPRVREKIEVASIEPAGT